MLFAKVKLFQFSKQLLELFKNYPKATEAQDEQRLMDWTSLVVTTGKRDGR